MDKIFIYENFNFFLLKNDIVFIRFKELILFNVYVLFICFMNIDFLINISCYVIGWG